MISSLAYRLRSLVGRSVALLTIVFSISAGAADSLGQRELTVPSKDLESKMDYISQNLSLVFDYFNPGLDSKSKLVAPLRVSGSPTRPNVQMSVQKCVLLICKTVDFNANFELNSVSGACTRNYQVVGDLSPSGEELSSNYKTLLIDVCVRGAEAQSKIEFKFSVDRDSRYSAGIVQREAWSMIKLQVDPMTEAVSKALASR